MGGGWPAVQNPTTWVPAWEMNRWDTRRCPRARNNVPNNSVAPSTSEPDLPPKTHGAESSTSGGLGELAESGLERCNPLLMVI